MSSGAHTMSDDKPNIPKQVSEHLVLTLNKMGPCTTYIDEYTNQFIQYAAKQTDPVLELGAAFGYVTIAALKEGATVIANDLDPRHLDILYNQTPADCKSRLTLLPGAFPQDVNLPDQSIAGCYVAHMLGYLDPPTLQTGFEKIFRFLKEGAKFFIIATTPYKWIFRKIIAEYERRVKENYLWPGYFTNLKELTDDRMPDSLNLFDKQVLSRELERVGFIIEKIELYARLDLPKRIIRYKREGIVAVVRKP